MKTKTNHFTFTRLTNGARQRASIFIAALFCSTMLSSFALAQNVNVSGSTGADGSYATLKDAFDALNTNTTQTGNTIAVSVIGDTAETATALLNQPAGGTWTSLTISPSGGATRTISGNLSAPLVILNGADAVVIDGLNTGGNGLTISNTSTSATVGTSTIKFINDATNNTITNCSILGSALVAVAADGGIFGFPLALRRVTTPTPYPTAILGLTGAVCRLS